MAYFVFPGPEFIDIPKVTEESTQTFSNSPLDHVRREAELMAEDVVLNMCDKNSKHPPNRYCKTIRRTVKEMSDRHDIVYNGMVNRLRPDENNTFQIFVIVSDEIFADGQVNWGRIVAVYAFGARLAKYYTDNNIIESERIIGVNNDPASSHSMSYQKKIASFVGKYVANKLGKWVLDHGGWDAFVKYFPDQGEFEEKMWKRVLFTTMGLGVLQLLLLFR